MNEEYCSSEGQSHEPKTFRNTPSHLRAAAFADTQDFSFEEICRRTVEAINWGMTAQAMDDSVVATRRTNV